MSKAPDNQPKRATHFNTRGNLDSSDLDSSDLDLSDDEASISFSELLLSSALHYQSTNAHDSNYISDDDVSASNVKHTVARPDSPTDRHFTPYTTPNNGPATQQQSVNPFDDFLDERTPAVTKTVSFKAPEPKSIVPPARISATMADNGPLKKFEFADTKSYDAAVLLLEEKGIAIATKTRRSSAFYIASKDSTALTTIQELLDLNGPAPAKATPVITEQQSDGVPKPRGKFANAIHATMASNILSSAVAKPSEPSAELGEQAFVSITEEHSLTKFKFAKKENYEAAITTLEADGITIKTKTPRSFAFYIPSREKETVNKVTEILTAEEIQQTAAAPQPSHSNIDILSSSAALSQPNKAPTAATPVLSATHTSRSISDTGTEMQKIPAIATTPQQDTLLGFDTVLPMESTSTTAKPIPGDNAPLAMEHSTAANTRKYTQEQIALALETVTGKKFPENLFFFQIGLDRALEKEGIYKGNTTYDLPSILSLEKVLTALKVKGDTKTLANNIHKNLAKETPAAPPPQVAAVSVDLMNADPASATHVSSAEPSKTYTPKAGLKRQTRIEISLRDSDSDSSLTSENPMLRSNTVRATAEPTSVIVKTARLTDHIKPQGLHLTHVATEIGNAIGITGKTETNLIEDSLRAKAKVGNNPFINCVAITKGIIEETIRVTLTGNKNSSVDPKDASTIASNILSSLQQKELTHAQGRR